MEGEWPPAGGAWDPASVDSQRRDGFWVAYEQNNKIFVRSDLLE